MSPSERSLRLVIRLSDEEYQEIQAAISPLTADRKSQGKTYSTAGIARELLLDWAVRDSSPAHEYFIQQRPDKYEFVRRLGILLSESQANMSFEELAGLLNRNNYRTDYGSDFQGGRGIIKLVKSAGSRAERRSKGDGRKVWEAFVSNRHGDIIHHR